MFFFYCTKVCIFWDDLKTLLNSVNITVSFDNKNVLLGILQCIDMSDSINILINYIALESKFFIYRCKLNKGPLKLSLLVNKFKKTFETERVIARKSNKIHFHDKKWKPLISFIQ